MSKKPTNRYPKKLDTKPYFLDCRGKKVDFENSWWVIGKDSSLETWELFANSDTASDHAVTVHMSDGQTAKVIVFHTRKDAVDALKRAEERGDETADELRYMLESKP